MKIDASHRECRPSRLKNRALWSGALVFFLLDVDQLRRRCWVKLSVRKLHMQRLKSAWKSGLADQDFLGRARADPGPTWACDLQRKEKLEDEEA